MSVQKLAGGWSGVCPHGLARLVTGDLIVSALNTPNVPLWTRNVGMVRNVDCWSHEANGQIRVGFTRGENNVDNVYVISQTGPPVFLGRGKTVNLRRKDGRWVAMIPRPSDGDGVWVLIDVDSGAVVAKGQDVKWSSTGIIDVTPDFKPVWAYAPAVKVDGLTLQNTHRAGKWIAAQGSKPSSFLVAYENKAGVLLLGEARDTKVAELLNGRAAFISRVEQGYGVAFAILSQDDVAKLPKPTTPNPPPPPPPEDDDDMAELDALKTRVSKLEARVTALEKEPPPNPPPTDPPPPSGNAPVIDLKAVKWLHTDISDWAETSQITDVTNKQGPAADQGTVCFPHTKAGQWPTFDNGTGEGNVLVFGQVNGKWYAACAEWLKPKQVCKRFTAQIGPPADDNWGIGPHTKKDPLASWAPKPGEWYGLMVSTRSRDSKRSVDAQGREVLERSNLYLSRWP